LFVCLNNVLIDIIIVIVIYQPMFPEDPGEEEVRSDCARVEAHASVKPIGTFLIPDRPLSIAVLRNDYLSEFRGVIPKYNK
jgi:hypothetical protein